MKMYVFGWDTKKDASGGYQGPPDNIEVQYSLRPEHIWTSHHLAESDLRNLRNMSVRVGPHQCDFSIEEQPDGNLTVVCAEHPAPEA
jgi:hypothetical protein